MAYGQQGRMGDRVNPGLFNPDFSGHANAGMIKGQAMSDIGAQVGDLIKERKQYKRNLEQNEKFIEQAYKMFEGTEMEAPIKDTMDKYMSDETTDRERFAIGQTIRETIGLGMSAQEMKMRKMALNAKLASGGESMVVSPAEADEFRKAGYAVEIVGKRKDGSLVIKNFKGKGVGTGKPEPFYNEETGVLGMAPGAPTSYLPTPGGISEAAEGYGGEPQPSAAGGIEAQLPSPGIPDAQHPPIPLDPVSATGGDYLPQELGTANTNLNLPAGQGGHSGGLLPGRGAQPQPAPSPSPSGPAPLGPMPQKDIWKIDESGTPTGATRVKDSTQEMEYNLKGADLAKAKADAAAAEAKKRENELKRITRKDLAEKSGKNLEREVDRGLAALDKISIAQNPLALIKRVGKGVAQPGTPEFDLQRSNKAIGSMLMLDSLKELKAASPTGSSGLGALNQKEAQSLQDQHGQLSLVDSPIVLRENLVDLRMRVFDTINQTPRMVDKLLEDGTITPEVHKEYYAERDALQRKLGLLEEEVSPSGHSTRTQRLLDRNPLGK